jgi:hypothetical protein
MSLLAVGWQPEFRGVLTVVIAFVVLCGSVYLILATNMGARLGFLVSFAALAGWMFIMGAIWWAYGKGLLGRAPSWQPVNDKSVLAGGEALNSVGILDGFAPSDPTDPVAVVRDTQQALVDAGWTQLSSTGAAFQQAGSAGTVVAEESGAFKAGEFQVTNVFELGGGRWPLLFGNESLDFFAFFHDDHHVLVEVAPLVPQRTEPGRAPARPIIDTTQPRQYVYLVRDVGALRDPAAYITIGSLIVFLMLCYMLHVRDRVVAVNRSKKALPAARA